MDGRQDVQRKSERLFKSQRGLIVALVLICLVIVGLVASIIVINITKVRQNDEMSGEMEKNFNIGGDECSGAETVYDMRVCIEHIYDEGQIEIANNMYDQRIENALSQKYYKLFLTLLDDKIYFLTDYKACEELFPYLDSFDVEVFPAETKMSFYNIAHSSSLNCKNEDRANIYEQKMEDLVETGEFDYDD